MNYLLINKNDSNDDSNKIIVNLLYHKETNILDIEINSIIYQVQLDNKYGFISITPQAPTNEQYTFNTNFKLLQPVDIVQYYMLDSEISYSNVELFIYKTTTGDVLLYKNFYYDSNFILKIQQDNFTCINTDLDFGDYIIQKYGEEEKFIFKKESMFIRNKSIYFRFINLITKRLYLDIECDLLFQYLKFLYNKNDKNIIEFLNSNSKYKLIYDSIVNNNMLDNENIIEPELKYKKMLYDITTNYLDNIDKISSANNKEDLNIVYNFDI